MCSFGRKSLDVSRVNQIDLSILRRITLTPDHDMFEKYGDIAPTSIAILLCNKHALFWLKIVLNYPFYGMHIPFAS